MAEINFSPLQNLKWLSIKYNYTEHLTKLVFGKFICGNKVFHFKTALILRKIHQMKDIWHAYYILNKYKRSHDTKATVVV